MSIPASAMEIGKIMDEKDLQPCFAALHIQPGNHRAFWEVIRSFIDTQDLDEKLFEDTSISAASREVHGEFKRSRTFNSIWKDPKWVDPAFVERLTNQGAEIRVAVEKELDVHLGKMWHFIFFLRAAADACSENPAAFNIWVSRKAAVMIQAGFEAGKHKGSQNLEKHV